MVKVGLISDTHGFLDSKVFKYFEDCDEIWHAGDIGQPAILTELSAFKPLKVVYGNIDNPKEFPDSYETLTFDLEGVKILMTHIGGRPGRYAKGIGALLKKQKPDLFICGHSHILRVEMDREFKVLYMNPGAAGHQGFHKKRTILRFAIDSGKPKNLEAIELGTRGRP